MRKVIRHLKAADPVLAGIIQQVGPCRIQYRETDFTALARAIVFQQLNGTAAATIFARTVAATGQGRLSPRAVLRTPVARLRAAGLSAAKTAYLRDLAENVVSGAIRFRRLPAMSDEDVIATLTQVKGIGVWTAHMFLLFALRRPDVLPVGDYGVRAAMKKAYGLPHLPKPAEMERIALPWRPYCSIASWYLWRSLQIK
jgi:DNA-3-methyladenine glycosylase II